VASVTYEHATRRYPKAERLAVDALDLQIHDGEFLVLVGPSGCGKSTSLRMLAGLETVDDGAVYIGDRDVTNVLPKERDVAMVFQNYALYPHMTVADNMSFALKMARVPRKETRERVLEAARILDLTEYLDRKPRALSGGQRQRVAMGRAIVRNPQVFLMDEPLSNLDAQLRVQTRRQIAALQRRLAVTTIYVTHDQVEAMTMGDRVAVMFDGRLQQVDTPNRLYARPLNRTVARFIGSPAMNLYEVTVVEGTADLSGYRIPLARETLAATKADGGATVVLGFRPEAVDTVGDGDGDGLPVLTEGVEELGSDAYLFASLPGRDELSDLGDLVVRIDPRAVPAKGQTVTIRIRPEEVHVFSASSGERLN
jgi:multiple sugar transport system ATP-binding protein